MTPSWIPKLWQNGLRTTKSRYWSDNRLLSPDIQHELLGRAASLLLRKIKAELWESPSTYISFEDAELTMFIQKLLRKVRGGQEFPSLIDVLNSCSPDIFPNINRLLSAIITIL
jgi:hypothetical protein